MSELEFRTFAPDLEVRSAGQGGDGRTIVGIAVPYNRPQVINRALTEQFARGAFNHQLRAAHRVIFARGHMDLGGTLIGRAVELRDDAAGLWGAWRVSATATGDETLELVRDGVLSQLSIGFVEDRNRRLGAGVVERVKAHLREVAVVMEGAYGELAAVTGVRAAHGDDSVCVCGGCTCGTARLDSARQALAGLPVLPIG